MPAPVVPSSKFKQQLDNNVYLRQKMREAFYLAYQTLYNAPLGALDSFQVTIDGVFFNFEGGNEIYINGNTYDSLEPKVKKLAYDRLEKFMQIALERYNTQFDL